MKKLCAWIMALTVCTCFMGTFCANAAGSNEAYPLLMETYESEKALDKILRGGKGTGEISVVEGGANGSAGALHVSQNSAGNYIDVSYPMEDLVIPVGQELEVSCWVKLKSELNTEVSMSNRVSLILGGEGTITDVGRREDVQIGDKGSGWKLLAVSGKLVKDEWVKISYNIVWDDSMTIGSDAMISNNVLNKISFRLADTNGTNAVVGNGNLEYEIDDFVLRYVVKGADPDTKGILAENDFDDSAVTGSLNGRSEDCSPAYEQQVFTKDQVDETLGYINKKNAEVTMNAKLAPGRLYKFSGWYRFDADETATDFSVEKMQLRLIMQGKDKNDVNFVSGSNYPTYYGAEIACGEWTKVEYYFYMDYKMYTTNPKSYLVLRLCPWASYKGGKTKRIADHTIPGTFSFDNIVIEDMGGPANGDMELDTDAQIVKNFANVSQVVPGWNPTGSTVELMTEGDNQYLKYTATKEKNGSVVTAFGFKANKTYEISFRAKVEGLEEGTTMPVSLILDRKITDVGTTDAYVVPNYEYLIGGDKLGSSTPKADHPWQISGEWQTFTTTYTTNFAVTEGMEEVAETVNPRACLMNILVYQNGVPTPQGTVICMDDFVVKEKVNAPCVENIRFTSGNSIVYVDYDYVPVNGVQENRNASFVRAYLKNGDAETNIGTFSAAEGFEVPSIALGKQIFFEVIPVAQDGTIGVSASAACDKIFHVSLQKQLTLSENKRNVSYECVLEDITGEMSDCVIAVAFYDKDSKMQKIYYEEILLMEGENEICDSISVPANTDKVKMMVLEVDTAKPLTSVAELVIPQESTVVE